MDIKNMMQCVGWINMSRLQREAVVKETKNLVVP
jgi:hypothetical protein